MREFELIYLSKIEHYEKINPYHWIIHAFDGMSQI